jgi:cytochrome c-type biogenesis protein CcmH
MLLAAVALLRPHPVWAEAPAGMSPDAESAVPLLEPPAYAPPDAETARLRTRAAAKGLRCPVCQGLSVADSNADSARAMYDRIAELVEQGYSEAQVLDYFSDRYGEWVRLEPAAEGLNLIIFVLPAAVLVLGGLFLVSRSRPAAEALSALPELSGDVNEEYRRRILEELGDGS